MTDPEKTQKHGDDWRQAILPNPFFVSEVARDNSSLVTAVSEPGSAEVGSNQLRHAHTTKPVLEENARGLLADFLPNFAGQLPQAIPILDGYDEPQTPLQAETQFLNTNLGDRAIGSQKEGPKLRGIGLIGAVFNELSKQLGREYSTAELMLAAQQLIDISKAEYVGIPYKDVAERAGYYSWDLVRAFGSHQWQIARVETNRMDHCDTEEFSPESFENAKLLLQGWNERTWEF